MARFIEDKLKQFCENLKEQSVRIRTQLEKLEYQLSDGYKKNNIPPADGWLPLTPQVELVGYDAHFWIKGNFETPQVGEHEYLMLEAITGMEDEWNGTNPQGLLYLNGEMVQGFDTNHYEAFVDPETAYEMYNYMYMGLQESPIRLKMKVCTIDERIEKLYYDVLVPYEACLTMEKTSEAYIAMISVLEQTANIVDMRDIYSESYYKSIKKADAFLEKELYKNLCSTKGKPVVNYIGHTHIDMEWLWDRAQTREKIQRSFSTAAALMKKYPEFKFMLSQPEIYQYLKEEAPEKYEELKQLVKDGRWEPEGSLYVESDCNLISGESFVRQILQGKKFFRDEFGVECKLLFLPDVFGYSAAMPQILKKCGIEYFVTSKISWNETNKMPVDEFMWQGIDGTEIFTSFITTQYAVRGQETKNGTTYEGYINSSMHKGAWDRFQQKEYSNRVVSTFGYCDGGGGPTKEHLEHYRRLEKGLPGMPAAEMGFIVPHLEKLKKQFDDYCKKIKRTPKWVGELYLEYHRGTYTSMAKNKRNNRKAELMLQKAEALSYQDLLFGGEYDSDGLYQNWTKVLHNQFHDIIPGSSIKAVYDGTDVDYAQIKEFGENVIGCKLQKLAGQVDAEGGVLVYNPLGFARTGTVVIDGVTREIDEPVPAFGWKVLNASERSGADGRKTGLCGVKVSKNVISNRYYKMTFDKAGRITSLKDLRAGREVFVQGALGNELQAFEDYPRAYDNWEISDYYKQKCWILDETADITPIYDGTRAGMKVVKKYLHSAITQKIWMYTESPRIDFETEIDWHEQHQILKAAFPVDVNTASATYDIQFGHVTRPTHANTSWEEAKFEVYGHKWVDIADNGYGLSLLNDCKYGFNAEGNTLKLTMLKCGTYPNPEADQGPHVFTYSLIPHVGDFREADVIKEAHSLNQPLLTVAMKKNNEGCKKLPAVFSLAACEQPNVILETVKKAEADDGMILRMYESFNRRCNATVTVAEGFAKAYLCDLMENVVSELDFDGHCVTIPVSNFEIVTLKFVK